MTALPSIVTNTSLYFNPAIAYLNLDNEICTTERSVSYKKHLETEYFFQTHLLKAVRHLYCAHKQNGWHNSIMLITCLDDRKLSKPHSLKFASICNNVAHIYAPACMYVCACIITKATTRLPLSWVSSCCGRRLPTNTLLFASLCVFTIYAAVMLFMTTNRAADGGDCRRRDDGLPSLASPIRWRIMIRHHRQYGVCGGSYTTESCECGGVLVFVFIRSAIW